MEANLLHDLGHTVRLMHREQQKRLEAYGLHWGQPRLLHYLMHHDGSPQHEIGAFLDIRPATLTKTVRRLEEAGFVRRERDAQDARLVRVWLSVRARDVMAALLAAMQEEEARALRGFSEEERDDLRDMLARIRANLGMPGPCCGGRSS